MIFHLIKILKCKLSQLCIIIIIVGFVEIITLISIYTGYFSWRNSTKGSWFIQALCKMLQEHGKSRDFLWILTRVAHTVAYDFESNASKEFMNKKKQVPQVVSMLTKDLYFKSKGTPV